MTELSDQELVARSINGDNSAFDQLVMRYQLAMYRTALSIVQDSDIAKDVTQIGFIKSWEKLHTYNVNYRFYSWLYRIIINESLNHNRSSKKMELLSSNQKQTETPHSKLEEKEDHRKLYDSIELLTTDQKIVIHLRHFEELSYREIADILEIDEKTVKSRLYGARMKLREILTGR
ncbi:MAG: RNA polymerase sigma factor [Balneolaceae bacterium]|nr:MAG: RNA polymerase sigma factor [Balneolaceae bacterium]